MAHMVFCTKYKAEMEGLDEPPFDSDFGNKVYKNVSKKAWGEWVERQKMLLNEYRLQPWTREAQEFLVEQMNEFFFGDGGCPAQGVRRSDALIPQLPHGASAIRSPRVHWELQVPLPSAPGSSAALDARNTSRDVAQPGRAHPWGG